MSFKVGDEVRIRTDLASGKRYSDLTLVPDMLKYLGEKSTIVDVDYDGTYQIRIDNGKFWWSDDMLEPVETKKAEPKLKLVIESDLKHNIRATQHIGKDVIRVEANCHPNDKFDLTNGLSLIFERLTDKMKSIMDDESKKPKHKPFLEYNGCYAGEVGEETDLVDILGNKLYVGDVVSEFCDGKATVKLHFVNWQYTNDAYGISFFHNADFENGRTHLDDHEYTIIKCVDHSDVASGLTVTLDGVTRKE